jgi:hypothetical protein
MANEAKMAGFDDEFSKLRQAIADSAVIARQELNTIALHLDPKGVITIGMRLQRPPYNSQVIAADARIFGDYIDRISAASEERLFRQVGKVLAVDSQAFL